MTELWWAIAVGLLLTMAVGLARMMTRPDNPDLMLASLLFGTAGAATVLVMGRALGLEHAVDIALVLALLAAVLGLAFVLRAWPEGDRPTGRDDR